mmetsp:Transcript_37738/g.95339  ORF Transcript_37738/g.95339 Transcript_37738/m.95339 type:complete len:171 (-) Transcript_37738:2395-2907(-)
MAALRWAATGGPAALSGRDVQLLPQRHELLARAGAHSAIEFLHWGFASRRVEAAEPADRTGHGALPSAEEQARPPHWHPYAGWTARLSEMQEEAGSSYTPWKIISSETRRMFAHPLLAGTAFVWLGCNSATLVGTAFVQATLQEAGKAAPQRISVQHWGASAAVWILRKD